MRASRWRVAIVSGPRGSTRAPTARPDGRSYSGRALRTRRNPSVLIPACHGGQGYATDTTDLKDWAQPLLGKDVSKTYLASDWRAPMQINKINSRGGVIGPDLNYEGDKSTEQHDCSRLSGVESEFAWHSAEFCNRSTFLPAPRVAKTTLPRLVKVIFWFYLRPSRELCHEPHFPPACHLFSNGHFLGVGQHPGC